VIHTSSHFLAFLFDVFVSYDRGGGGGGGYDRGGGGGGGYDRGSGG
jgi:hypothetical protein